QESKGKDIIAKVKSDSKKTEQKEDVPKKEVPEGLKKTDTAKKKVEQAKDPDKSYQDAIEEIRKRVARRSEEEKLTSKGSPKGEGGGEGQPTAGSSSGTLGPGGGTGTGGGASGSSVGGSKLDVYYSQIWTKIKKEWALPEDLSKANLETIIIVVIDRAGRIQKSLFEKKSGNVLYDQSAMRAIKKADPFPPIPQELSDDTLVFGFIFSPKMAR
ncbi:MAG: TonB family protein, partial [Desulfobacterales bacterium]|nr:TonB family protein [Desulfobacterales bacterium]